MWRTFKSKASCGLSGGGEECEENDLEREVASHSCPVCYELMRAKEGREPIVLAPCGHTFCENCLRVHLEHQGKNKCPVCRGRVQSTAKNVSLRRIIESYVDQEEKRDDENTKCKEEMSRDLRFIAQRVKHLRANLPEIKQEEQRAFDNLQSAQTTLEGLRQEESDMPSQIEERKRIVAVVKEQVHQQENKVFELEQSHQQMKEKVNLIEQSLSELHSRSSCPSSETRINVLESELPSAKREEQNALSDLQSSQIVLYRLREDLREAERQVEEAESHAKGLSQRIMEQERVISELSTSNEHASNRSKLVESSLSELEMEERKLRLLLSSSSGEQAE